MEQKDIYMAVIGRDEAYERSLTTLKEALNVGIISEGSTTTSQFIKSLDEMKKRLTEIHNEYAMSRWSEIENRCEKLGYDIRLVAGYAQVMNTDIEHCLDLMEQIEAKVEEDRKRVVALSLVFDNPANRNLYIPEPEEGPGLSEAQIKKQLKYEKNPMRIKQLNIMLNKKRKENKLSERR